MESNPESPLPPGEGGAKRRVRGVTLGETVSQASRPSPAASPLPSPGGRGRWSLRTKIVLYFVILHVVLAAAAVFVLMENRILLFAVEVLFVVSIVVSYRLVRALFVPLDLIATGAELIAERDFTSRFVAVGQP